MELLTLFKSLHEEHPIQIVEESEIPEDFQENISILILDFFISLFIWFE